jgi:tyrosyl-tRNA synthetase
MRDEHYAIVGDMKKPSTNNIDEILTRSISAIYPSAPALRARLLEGKPLRIYVGIDPTASYVHLGHATNYLLMRRFYELGHKIIVLVGDFTALIGDPSDKTSARVQLTPAEVKQNLKTFKEQIGKILDFESKANPIEFRFNAEWLGRLTFTDVIDLASNFTVQQMIERDTFQKRLSDQKPLFVHEFFYPLMQGYDSVMLEADVEIGGTDQTFNMLAGRTLVKRYQDREKFVITTTLLENPATGEKLMSKSLGTGIGLNEAPNEMYAKVMALPDEAIIQVFIDCTVLPLADIDILKTALVNGENPRNVKMSLAREIVATYHSDKLATEAERIWTSQVSAGERPEELEIKQVNDPDASMVDVLIEVGFATSKMEAKRLIEQHGVRLNDSVYEDLSDARPFMNGDIIQVGKRRFVQLKLKT